MNLESFRMRSREADQRPSSWGVENKAGWWKREGTISQSVCREQDKAHSESLPGVRYSEHVDGMPLTKGDPGHLDVTRKPQGLGLCRKSQFSNPKKLL